MSNQKLNILCPCGSHESYVACCGRLHQGMKAESASQLMRARYSAYAVKNVDFIMRTTHPLNPHYNRRHGAWRLELMQWCKKAQFEGLEIVEIQEEAESKEAYVTFKAYLKLGEQPYILHEKSFFVKTDSGWFYRDGTHLTG